MDLMFIKSGWIQIDFNQFFYLYSHKENCDNNKHKQYRNSIHVQSIKSFDNHLEDI